MARHTVKMPCIADTYTNAFEPNANYGRQGTIVSNRIKDFASYPGWPSVKNNYLAMLKFDTSVVPANKKFVDFHLFMALAASPPWTSSSSTTSLIGTIYWYRVDWIAYPSFSWDEYSVTRSSLLSNPPDSQVQWAGESDPNSSTNHGVYTGPDQPIMPKTPLNTYIKAMSAHHIWERNAGSTVWTDKGVNPAFDILSIMGSHGSISLVATAFVTFTDDANPRLTFHSRESSYPPYIEYTYDDAPPLKPLPQYPIGVSTNTTRPTKFEWQYMTEVSDSQVSFRLEWQLSGTSTWNVITKTTSDNFYTLAGGTLPNGTINWRVVTFNQYGEQSPYSNTSSFFSISTPAVPVIDAIASNYARPTISWTFTNQDLWELEIVKDGEVVYHVPPSPDYTTNSHMVTEYLPNGSYVARLRIRNINNLWSEWAERVFLLNWISPVGVTMSAYPDDIGVRAVIDLDGSDGVGLYRDGVLIANVTKEMEGEYYDIGASAGEHTYFARIVEGGGYADSPPVTVTLKLARSVVCPVGDPGLALFMSINLNEYPARQYGYARQNAATQFVGRKFAVRELGELYTEQMGLTFYVRDRQDRQKINELIENDSTLILRTPDGDRLFCTASLDETAVVQPLGGWQTGVTFASIDYSERIDDIIASTASRLPVGNVINLIATPGEALIKLSWSDPADRIVNGIEATWAGTAVVYRTDRYPESPTDGTVYVDNKIPDAFAVNPLTITGLAAGTYYFSLFPYTETGIITNDAANRVSAEPRFTPVGPVTDLTLTPDQTTVLLTWRDPEDTSVNGEPAATWAGTKAVYRLDRYPGTEDDGTLLADSTTRDEYATTPISIALDEDVTAYVTMFPRNIHGAVNYDEQNRASATALYGGIGNVTELTLIAGEHSLALTWRDPVDNVATWGGTVVVVKRDSYPVDENDGSVIVNSTVRDAYAETPLEITGLVPGELYWFHLFPYNTQGKINREDANRISGSPKAGEAKGNTIMGNTFDGNAVGVLIRGDDG